MKAPFLSTVSDAANATMIDGTSDNDVTPLMTAIKHVTAQTNGTAVLPCKITDLGTGIVSSKEKEDPPLRTPSSIRQIYRIKSNIVTLTLDSPNASARVCQLMRINNMLIFIEQTSQSEQVEFTRVAPVVCQKH